MLRTECSLKLLSVASCAFSPPPVSAQSLTRSRVLNDAAEPRVSATASGVCRLSLHLWSVRNCIVSAWMWMVSVAFT